MALEIPDAPAQAAVVDASRKITIPWKGWLADLVAALRAALEGVGLLEAKVAQGLPPAIARVELELGRPRRGGYVVFEPEGGFTTAQIGAPVLVQLRPRGDGAQGLLTFASAEVVDRRRMRIDWSASSALGGAVTVHFAIGG